jgi:hypothetical protein
VRLPRTKGRTTAAAIGDNPLIQREFGQAPFQLSQWNIQRPRDLGEAGKCVLRTHGRHLTGLTIIRQDD